MTEDLPRSNPQYQESRIRGFFLSWVAGEDRHAHPRWNTFMAGTELSLWDTIY